MKDWAVEHVEDINKFAVLESGYLGLVTPNNGLELSDGIIRLKGSDGQELGTFWKDGTTWITLQNM